jgi:hypothetical protein
LRKVGRIRPATDGEKNLQLAVALLQQEELLDRAVHVGADVIPRVRSIVLVGVGPGVGEVDLTSIGVDIGESIEHMSKRRGGQILGIVVARIDSLWHVSTEMESGEGLTYPIYEVGDILESGRGTVDGVVDRLRNCYSLGSSGESQRDESG